MKIVMAASEATPFASTGGLAGVIGSLPNILDEAGHEVVLFLPHFKDVRITGSQIIQKQVIKAEGREFTVTETRFPKGGVRVFLIAKEKYFNRSGFYGPTDDSGWEDNSERFSFFCRAVCFAMKKLLQNVDIVHCHDWQTGLIPAYMQHSRTPAVVYTIHNLQYQGNFPPEDFKITKLPMKLFSPSGMEFYGNFSFMKAGIIYSDIITTVSPTYAGEILTERFGCGMEGVLQNRSDVLSGILNGIDTKLWDPANDSAIASSYHANSITPRKQCRKELIRLFGLSDTNNCMITGMVTRLTWQKGIDLLFPIAEKLVEQNIKLAILGTGEKKYRDRLESLAGKFPGSISCIFKYDDTIARKIFAGSDLYLMPSRFEPCGLAQMSAMRYGAVPLVNKTGGLTDTVEDVMSGGCGFVFERESPQELLSTISRAGAYFKNRHRWAHLVKKCMREDNSWKHRAGEFEKVYRNAIQNRKNR